VIGGFVEVMPGSSSQRGLVGDGGVDLLGAGLDKGQGADRAAAGAKDRGRAGTTIMAGLRASRSARPGGPECLAGRQRHWAGRVSTTMIRPPAGVRLRRSLHPR